MLSITLDNIGELLTLSSTLNPKGFYKLLNVERICQMVTNLILMILLGRKNCISKYKLNIVNFMSLLIMK